MCWRPQSEAHTREEIVRLAIARARERYGCTYLRIVSVGDGVWDVRTAQQLQLPFVGVAQGAHAEALRAAGARIVLRDLADASAVLNALESATVNET